MVKFIVWLLVALLLVFHQGYHYWYWDNATLVFGFLPYSLAFHCVISIFTSIVLVLLTRYAWPTKYLEKFEVATDILKGEQS